MDFLKVLRKLIYARTSNYVRHATFVEGTLKGGSGPFKCLFVEDSALLKYVSVTAYESPPDIIKTNRILIKNLRKIIRNATKDTDMCVALLPLGHEVGFDDIIHFKAQEWVHQILDISSPWEKIKERFHKNPKETMRKIRKYNLTYRISHDISDFELFYYQMFLPLIRKQYGNSAYTDTYQEMKEYFDKGFLLIVMDGDNPVSGGLCWAKDDIMIFRRVGVLNGDKNYIKNGAQSAVYQFIISYSKENNFRKVDLMKSRSFLDDGVYITKREWGAATYVDDEADSWMHIFILRHSENVARFFEYNPLVIHTKQGLRGLVGWSGPGVLSKENEKALSRKYYSPGLSGLSLIMPESGTITELPFKDS